MKMIDKAKFEQYKEELNKRLQRLEELQEENKIKVLQMFHEERNENE